MRRPPLYSRPTGSPSSRPTDARAAAQPAPAPVSPGMASAPGMPGAGPGAAAATAATGEGRAARWRRVRAMARKPSHWHAGLLWLAVVLLGAALYATDPSPVPALTQEDFDRGVMRTVATHVLPSQEARAYQAIIPSVVRVVSYEKPQGAAAGGKGKPQAAARAPSASKERGKAGAAPPRTPQAPGADLEERSGEEASALVPEGYERRGVGTGVVIVDNGTILTNLHVVQGADLLHLTFMDGTESTATVAGVQAKDDLAVLRAATLPDDLQAATLASTAGLGPGEHVMAVGFPFGIGPSASGGVVSGLKRSFQSPQGEQMMTNLIQFDAAANPGNSGGPLVNMAGEVVGIVTAIYNPNQQGSFVGIGFAVPIENAASAAGMSPF